MNHKLAALSLAFIVSISAFSVANAADNKKAWTSAETATKEDPDFAIQGEYTGEIDGQQWGIHVVAEGNGSFALVAYPGGLPGAGFTGNKEQRIKGTAKRNAGGVVEGTIGEHRGVFKDGAIIGDAGKFTKVNRKSETLGAKPPEGAIVLFDGKSPDAFKGGKLDGELLMQGVTSKQLFQDFTLHVEFQIPYQPTARGQGRGNSGCYLQGRYELQMLDSFGLEGENNECGGVYTIAKPAVNMAFPPLTWQSYDIDYTAAKFDASGKKTANAKMTAKHNGVLIHDGLELTHATTASPLKESPEPGPVYFQDHGNPVRYRNIWLKEKK
jgi:hypothetical protein